MAALDEIALIIPKLEAAHVSTANLVCSRLNVPNKFLATVTAAVEQTPESQAVRKLNVNEARDTLQFLEAFRPVRDKVDAFAKNLKHTLGSRKATLATQSLQVTTSQRVSLVTQTALRSRRSSRTIESWPSPTVPHPNTLLDARARFTDRRIALEHTWEPTDELRNKLFAAATNRRAPLVGSWERASVVIQVPVAARKKFSLLTCFTTHYSAKLR